MHTVYLHRWTEDAQEDMDAVKAENALFIDGRETTRTSGGLLRLLERLGGS